MDYIPESPYERMRPLRESFTLRLNTFNNWPRNNSVEPLDLVRDYFYYIGIEDKCQCTYCGGVLGGWRPGDVVHREHIKHFPDCPFIKQCNQNQPSIVPQLQSGNEGQNLFANSPAQFSSASQVPMESMETGAAPEGPADRPGITRPKYREYQFEHVRLASFTGWPSQIKQRPEILAQAGFFYLGQGDKVKCFYCGGILWDWDPDDEPYTEHAKWFPKCPWLSLSKGNSFVERVQKELMNMNINQPAEETNVKSVEDTRPKEIPNDPPLSTAGPSTIPSKSTSTNDKDRLYSSEHKLNENEQINIAEIVAENKRIKEERQCKICMDEDVSVVFFPCGHLSCCPKCAVAVDKCPICRKAIEKQVKIYW